MQRGTTFGAKSVQGGTEIHIAEYLEELKAGETRFKRLVAICEDVFGAPRVRGSHHIFKMPWPGDPRINLQADGKSAKPYQVRQVRKALERILEDLDPSDEGE